MKNTIVKIMLLSSVSAILFVSGCSFVAGAAVGAAGTGAAYEYSSKRQLDRLEEDYKAGNITQEVYESRKKQIQEGSIIY